MVTTSARGIVRDGLISYVVLKPPAPFNTMMENLPHFVFPLVIEAVNWYVK